MFSTGAQNWVLTIWVSLARGSKLGLNNPEIFYSSILDQNSTLWNFLLLQFAKVGDKLQCLTKGNLSSLV